MATITPEKLEQLLAPVSEETPVGESIEYDPDYLELQRISSVVPEQQIGTTIVPAVEPEWRDVRIAALDLAGRSKDLRVLVHLATALLKTEGVPGLRDGLQLLKGTVGRYWELVYPRLDPDDDNDPMERMNILRVFASRDVGGALSVMVRELRNAPLTDSKLVGRFGLKDIAAALAPPAPEDGSAPAAKKVEMGLIEAAAKDTPLEFLQTAADAAAQAIDLARSLEKSIDERVGMGRGIDFKEFVKTLGEASAYLNKFLAMHGVGDAGAETAEGGAAGGGGGTGGGGAGAAISGDIRSRADVAKVLEKICDYYARSEPASPIPLILKRAQRLLNKDFWGIIMDMAPDSVGIVQTITGSPPPEQTA